VRTLASVSIAAAGDVLRFDFRANAYLHHMIRNIVGALVYVGAGKQAPAWMAELLAGRDRTRAARRSPRTGSISPASTTT
jgi:tRNA pseudouridine38-40 synthase